jgi:hypothetical protein
LGMAVSELGFHTLFSPRKPSCCCPLRYASLRLASPRCAPLLRVVFSTSIRWADRLQLVAPSHSVAAITARVAELLPAAVLLGASSGNLIYTLSHGTSEQAGPGAVFRYAEAVTRGEVEGVSLTAVRRSRCEPGPLPSQHNISPSRRSRNHDRTHAALHTAASVIVSLPASPTPASPTPRILASSHPRILAVGHLAHDA